MIKKLTLSICLLFILSIVYGQNVSFSPSENSEVCPLTEITFTVTVKSMSNPSGPSATAVSSTATPQVTVNATFVSATTDTSGENHYYL